MVMYFCPMHRLILLFAFVGTLSTHTYAQVDALTWEARITYDASNINSSSLRTVSGVASDALVPLSIGLPVTMYALGALGAFASSEDNAYMAESGIQTAVTMGVTYGLVLGLKSIIDRDRPYEQYPGTIINYREDHDGSFPSGHSAGSAALATSLSLRYPHWYVIVPSVTYALYTGFSRLNLGMHYLSEVLSGYALGIGVALAVNALNHHLFRIAGDLIPNRTVESPLPMGLMHRDYTPLFAVSLPL